MENLSKTFKEKRTKSFYKYVSIGYLFNSACSYTTNPIRINPILFSIALYHQKG